MIWGEGLGGNISKYSQLCQGSSEYCTLSLACLKYWYLWHLKYLFIFVSRLDNYIKLAKDHLGLEILPTNNFKSFIFSMTNLDKSDPERKFLCEITLSESETGKQKYSGTISFKSGHLRWYRVNGNISLNARPHL